MILSKVRAVAAKVETTVGTAVTLSSGDLIQGCFNPICNPDAEFIGRENEAGIVGNSSGTITFRTELYGNGSGGVPAWASTLFPAAGLVNASGTFSCKLESPGANVKTLTVGVFHRGGLKTIYGAVGNVVFTWGGGGPITLDWTFRGVWGGVADTTMPDTSVPSAPMRAKGVSVTLGSFSPCFSQMTLDLGNEMAARECIGNTAGIHSWIISNRKPVGTLDPESKLVATEPTYANWRDSVEREMTVTCSNATDEIVFTAPRFQLVNAQEGDRNGIMVDTLNYQLNRTGTTNNDLTIAFGAS
jgi:hypothetical protein